jgi:Peptidase family M48
MSGPAKAVVAFVVGRPLIAIAIAAAVVGVMLLHTHHQKTPATHRSQHVGLTDAQQMQLGSQEFAKTLRANRARIVSSGPQYAEVQHVARRIESIASRDKPDFIWRVTLIKKNEANAYCLPGGKIVVYTGILPFTENDAGLATVLGHEVAHATAEHVAERIERSKLTEVAATIIAGGRRLHAGAVRADHRAARRRRESAVQPVAGVRGGPRRTRLHGESGLRPASGGRVLEAHATRVARARAAGVPQRPPERRASRRSGAGLVAGGRPRVQAAHLSATRHGSRRHCALLTRWLRRARWAEDEWHPSGSRSQRGIPRSIRTSPPEAPDHKKPFEQDRNGVSWPA